MDNEKIYFVCYEYEKDKYSNSSVRHEDVGLMTSEELSVLEHFYLNNEQYKGSICNIISHKPFMENDIKNGLYMCRYLINGTGSFEHMDFVYSGAIDSFEDIRLIEENIANELNVKKVVVTDFMFIEEVEPERLRE